MLNFKFRVLFLLFCCLLFVGVKSNPAQSEIIQSKAESIKLLEDFMDISNQNPNGGKQDTFSNLDDSAKAELFRFHLAMKLANHSNLTNEQKELLLDSIARVDEAYYSRSRAVKSGSDIELESKLNSYFSKEEIFSFFSSIGATPLEQKDIGKFLEILKTSDKSSQKQVFVNLTPADKKAVWRVKLAVNLASGRLDRKTQELILLGFHTLDEDAVYNEVLAAESKIILKSFEERAISQMPKEDFFRLFVSLDGENGCTLVKQDNPSLRPPICSCSYSEWCQWAFGTFVTCQGGCQITPTGCGVFLGSECSGTCRGVF